MPFFPAVIILTYARMSSSKKTFLEGKKEKSGQKCVFQIRFQEENSLLWDFVYFAGMDDTLLAAAAFTKKRSASREDKSEKKNDERKKIKDSASLCHV